MKPAALLLLLAGIIAIAADTPSTPPTVPAARFELHTGYTPDKETVTLRFEPATGRTWLLHVTQQTNRAGQRARVIGWIEVEEDLLAYIAEIEAEKQRPPLTELPKPFWMK